LTRSTVFQASAGLLPVLPSFPFGEIKKVAAQAGAIASQAKRIQTEGFIGDRWNPEFITMLAKIAIGPQSIGPINPTIVPKTKSELD